MGVAFPAIVLFAILARNYTITGIPTPSSQSGHTSLLFVMVKENWNLERVEPLVRAAGAPNWYVWCFTNPWIPPGANPEVYRVWQPTIAGCVPWIDNDFRHPNWDYLLEVLTKLNADPAIIDQVREEKRIESERPYLRTGTAATWGSTWVTQYNRVSGQIAAYVFRADPVGWITASKYIHGNMFTRLGPELIPNLRSSLATSVTFFNSLAYSAAYEIFAEVTRYTYLALPIIVLVLIGAIAAWWFDRMTKALADSRALLYTVACAVALATAIGFLAIYIDLIEWFYYAWPRRYYRVLPVAIGVGWLGLATYSAFARRRNASDSSAILRLTLTRQSAAMWLSLATTLLMLGAIFSTVVGTENDRFFTLLGPHLVVSAAILLTAGLRLIRLAISGICGVHKK